MEGLASVAGLSHHLAVRAVHLILLTTVLGCPAWVIHAQEPTGETQSADDTRAATLRAAREKKQQETVPPEPNVLERGLRAIERGGVPLITRDGLYAKLGSLTTGSGFAYGAGYRSHRFFDRDAGLDFWAGATMTQVPGPPRHACNCRSRRTAASLQTLTGGVTITRRRTSSGLGPIRPEPITRRSGRWRPPLARG